MENVKSIFRNIGEFLETCCMSEAEYLLPFTVTDVEQCIACTNLTRSDILKLWRRFRKSRFETPATIAEANPLASGFAQFNESKEESEDFVPAQCLGTPWNSEKVYAKDEICSLQVGGVWMPFVSLKDNNVGNKIDATPTSPTKEFWKYDPFSETITEEEMKSFASMRSNPFSTRFVEAFSDRKDGRLTFEELVDVYSLFHNRASLAEKVKSVFKLLDVDGDGFITPSDMKEVLYISVKGGFDWDAREERLLKEKRDAFEVSRKAIYHFMEYIVAQRSEDGDELLSPSQKGKKGKSRRGSDARKTSASTVELDGRKKARVETWVEATLKKYSDHVEQAKSEDEFCKLEHIPEKDLRKVAVRLEERAVAGIVTMLKMEIEELARWDYEIAGNPLAEDPLTAPFAELTYGKNLMIEMAAHVLEEKTSLMVVDFLEIYIDPKQTDADLRASKIYELSIVLNRFLQDIALEECLLNRAKDPKADAAKDVIEGDDVDLYELPPWRQMIMAFLKCDVARAQAAKDEITDEDKQKALWNEIMFSLFEVSDIKMIISKMMLEGDPSITEEDQKENGWDKTGQISCQEFSKVASAQADFAKRFEMNEV